MNRASRRAAARQPTPFPQAVPQAATKRGSLLICTPAYGGLVYVDYVQSLVDTVPFLGSKGIETGCYFLKNESLIPRGRNACAKFALDSGVEKLLFVDSDISWKSEDVLRLYHSDKMIIGGAYPVKRYPILMNFNPLPQHNHLFPGNKKTLDNFAEYRKYGNGFSEIEVTHLATGFLMIDCRVFRALLPRVRSYDTGGLINGQSDTHHDFFRSGAHPSGTYESEDWGFCNLARENGFSVWLNTDILLPHTGTHTFDPNKTAKETL